MTSEKRLMKRNGQPAGNKILPAPFFVRGHGVRGHGLQLAHRLKRIVEIELAVSPLPVRIFHRFRADRTEYEEAADLEGVNPRYFSDIDEPFQHEGHRAGGDGRGGAGTGPGGEPPFGKQTCNIDAGGGDIRFHAPCARIAASRYLGERICISVVKRDDNRAVRAGRACKSRIRVRL